MIIGKRFLRCFITDRHGIQFGGSGSRGHQYRSGHRDIRIACYQLDFRFPVFRATVIADNGPARHIHPVFFFIQPGNIMGTPADPVRQIVQFESTASAILTGHPDSQYRFTM